jgi:HPt (histidine-containing phosphotransfer) domain-containing protein
MENWRDDLVMMREYYKLITETAGEYKTAYKWLSDKLPKIMEAIKSADFVTQTAYIQEDIHSIKGSIGSIGQATAHSNDRITKIESRLKDVEMQTREIIFYIRDITTKKTHKKSWWRRLLWNM